MDLAAMGQGIPDIAVGYRNHRNIPRNIFIEIKSDKGTLRDSQIEFISTWIGSVSVVRSEKDAITLLEKLIAID